MPYDREYVVFGYPLANFSFVVKVLQVACAFKVKNFVYGFSSRLGNVNEYKLFIFESSWVRAAEKSLDFLSRYPGNDCGIYPSDFARKFHVGVFYVRFFWSAKLSFLIIYQLADAPHSSARVNDIGRARGAFITARVKLDKIRMKMLLSSI